MAVHKTDIETFLELAAQHPVFDVRSPGEYAHAHIPGAHSLPLFSDEERKVVGTTYKQESREQAIKIGLDYFGPKMRRMVEEVEGIAKADKTILVHCWRGGMRSAAVAWLLDLYGFKVYTLVQGYKAYRHWVLAQLELEYPFAMLGGYTGSGKTDILARLKQAGELVIDLEDLAKHKGSAFGGLDKIVAPGQEMFDNMLATELHAAKTKHPGKTIWLEDESQRIGLINLSNAFWKTMRAAPVWFIDVPFEQRLDYLVTGYGKYPHEQLVSAIMRIKKRLGGLETKTAINALLEGDVKECFRVLLHYYDKHYKKALEGRDKVALHKIDCADADPVQNVKRLLAGITNT